MESALAHHFASVRRRKGLGLAQLARMVGYQNVSKGCRRIDNFEKFGLIHEQLLVKLAAALGIDHQTATRLIEEDRQRYLRDWEQWANTPIRPSIILGHIGGIGWTEALPDDITQEQAEQYASAVAKEKKRPICLVMSRRLSVQFDSEGNRTSINEAKPGNINVPYLRLVAARSALTSGLARCSHWTNRRNRGRKKSSPTLAASGFGRSFEVVEGEPGRSDHQHRRADLRV